MASSHSFATPAHDPASFEVKQAAVYLRRSTNEPTQANSLRDQLKEVRRGAQQMGIEIIEELIFVGDGISGTSMKERLGLQKMLDMVRTISKSALPRARHRAEERRERLPKPLIEAARRPYARKCRPSQNGPRK